MEASPDAIHTYLRNENVQMRKDRKLGRTLYLHFATDPWEVDLCVGIVDSEQLADAIVTLWNQHYREAR